MKKTILKAFVGFLECVLGLAVFFGGMWLSLWMMAGGETVHASEVAVCDYEDWFETGQIFAETTTETSSESPQDASGGLQRREDGSIDILSFLASIEPMEHAGTLYEDSHGAVAYGWELNEAVRLVMLESGAESDEDIREHCALLCKQLYYTQVVGGWDDWGTRLAGIIHGGHSYIQTAPYIWEDWATPTERVTEIFWDVWFNGYLSDFRVQCFRSTCYHTWAISAYQIGKTYYSVNPWQDFSMFDLDENGVLQYK